MKEPQERKSLQTLIDLAEEYHISGRALDAVQTQVEVVNQQLEAGQSNIQASKKLGVYLFNLGDFGSAVKVLQSIQKKAPYDSEIPENIGVLLNRMGHPKAAIQAFETALNLNSESFNLHDGLAAAYGKLGNLSKTRHHGECSLLLKDQVAATQGMPVHIPNKPPSPFRWDTPSQNIIAFSLWGDNARYLDGAIRNATLAPDIYPGWQCRFYCDDSVPNQCREFLQHQGAEIIMMPRPQNFFDGLLWRFLVAEDPNVSRFLVRDCDAVINIKERVAVDEWLASDYYFHIMRDFYTHTEVILAGMWGGIGGVLPSQKALLDQFRPTTLATRTYDQIFLREAVYPTVRQSCMIHDRLFRVLHARSFPVYGGLSPEKHIGQNEAFSKTKLKNNKEKN